MPIADTRGLAADASEVTQVGVAIMAKPPIAGQAKTRLCGELSMEEAAELYGAMLADRCAQVANLPNVVPAIAVAEPVESDFAPTGFELIVQSGKGLGRGLASACDFFAERGLSAVMVDSDSPTLPISFLEEATEALRSHCDLVIGPSEDGGYYLIGLAKPQPTLLEDIPWSTSQVTAVTLERAQALGLKVHMLPLWNDVDTPEDLARLQDALFQSWWPTQTAAFLRNREMARLQERYASRSPAKSSTHHEAEQLFERPWDRLLRRPVYATPWLSIHEDRVRMPSGSISTYSVVDCGECVGILPFVDAETVLLVRQYRYVAGQTTWEMPTGGVDSGETHLRAAERELATEAQVSGKLSYLGRYHTSKSVMDETAHLYVARNLTPVTAQCDETEFLRTEAVPFARALEMVLSGEILDSMTIIAILRVARADASL